MTERVGYRDYRELDWLRERYESGRESARLRERYERERFVERRGLCMEINRTMDAGAVTGREASATGRIKDAERSAAATGRESAGTGKAAAMTADKSYYPVYQWMITGLGLKNAELQVYAAVYSFRTTAAGEYFGSMTTLGRKTDNSYSTVKRVLRRLCEKGLLIRIDGGAGHSNRYRVNEARAAEARGSDATPVTVTRGVGHDDLTTRVKMTHDNTEEKKERSFKGTQKSFSNKGNGSGGSVLRGRNSPVIGRADKNRDTSLVRRAVESRLAAQAQECEAGCGGKGGLPAGEECEREAGHGKSGSESAAEEREREAGRGGKGSDGHENNAYMRRKTDDENDADRTLRQRREQEKTHSGKGGDGHENNGPVRRKSDDENDADGTLRQRREQEKTHSGKGGCGHEQNADTAGQE